MYFSHSQNTMRENFRVPTEGLIPSTNVKSVGTEILLYFVAILLAFKNISLVLTAITVLKLAKCIVKFKGRTLPFLEAEDHEDSA